MSFAICAAWLSVGLPIAASATETVRVGVLKFGTVSWELDVIRTHRLDVASGVRIEVLELASNEATKVALQAGAVDIIASDWLWVSRQRGAGVPLTFVPFSASVGAVMVAPDSPIRTVADLRGGTIGVAGGPFDKGWLLVRALASRDFNLDLDAEATPVFAAPPLLSEKLQHGELDAALSFWTYNAALAAKGYRQLIGVGDASLKLGATGPVASVGYVFSEEWANMHLATARGFLQASRSAKAMLETSNEEWERLRPLMGATDDAMFLQLRDGFRNGIPKRPIAEEEADAARIYAVLAKLGGSRLVGEAETMAPGTYWSALTRGF